MPHPGTDRTPNAPHADIGIGALALRVVDDAKRWAGAEAGFYKGLASDRAGDAGVGIGLAVAILMLVQALLVLLLVGGVLTLAPSIGPGWATLLMAAVALAAIAILAVMARGRLRQVARPIPKDPT